MGGQEEAALMGARTWQSPSPMSTRLGIAGWLRYLAHREHTGPAVTKTASFCTLVLASNTIVVDVQTEEIFMPIAPVKYATPAIRCNLVELEDGTKLFYMNLADGYCVKHITTMDRYLCVPTVAISPKHLFEEFASMLRCCR